MSELSRKEDDVSLFRMVKLPSNEPVQYVGVYVLKWGDELPEPTVGFIPVEENEFRKQTVVADSGSTITDVKQQIG